MSDQYATIPRVYIMRHGKTNWAQEGRFTGISDVELNTSGIAQIKSTAATFVGPGKVIDPSRLALAFVSPRKRAQQTLDLLNLPSSLEVTTTDAIAEWDYGNYEAMTLAEIEASRKEDGLDKEREWSVWSDGCIGGESPDQVTKRLDRFIKEIQETQKRCVNGERPADVLIVAHGLILRCFVKRWQNLAVDSSLGMRFEPAAICTLSYKNSKLEGPLWCLGNAVES